MAEYDFDLFVIGAGSGGMRAARMSGSYGAKVAIAEDRPLGGTCVNVGCIPKKLLVYASHFREDFEDAVAGYGWTVGERSFDWATLIENKNKEIERLNDVYAGLLSNAGVELVRGRATVVDAHTVSVGGEHYRAERILVATGGRPIVPDLPGAEHAITSDAAFFLEKLPKRVLVVGGGYIAVEFAGIFHGLGAEVIQIYRGPLFLRGFDDDVRSFLAAEMRKKSIDLRFDLNIDEIQKTSDGLRAKLTDGSSLDVDQVMFATGRAPNTKGLGLEEVGVKLSDKAAVIVDEYSCSSVPNIYAIGDVTDRIALTPVAIHEGMCLASTLYLDKPLAPDHADVPSAVFSQPPIGSVGLTEAAAAERYGELDVYVSEFRTLKHTLTGSSEKMFMKLIVDRASDRVVGLHVVGPDSGEITQGFAMGIKMKATKADFDATLSIHPTSAEELVTMREPRA